MSTVDITRAWKDPVYRAGLDPVQLAGLPANPVGSVELTDADLSVIDGGSGLTTTVVLTWEAGCFTFNNTWCNGQCGFLTMGAC